MDDPLISEVFFPIIFFFYKKFNFIYIFEKGLGCTVIEMVNYYKFLINLVYVNTEKKFLTYIINSVQDILHIMNIKIQ